MNQDPEKNRNNQAYQKNRKLISKLLNFSFSGIPDKFNEFRFQVVRIGKP
jgi:hypothetical protein